jgi:hypothetical protein
MTLPFNLTVDNVHAVPYLHTIPTYGTYLRYVRGVPCWRYLPYSNLMIPYKSKTQIAIGKSEIKILALESAISEAVK